MNDKPQKPTEMSEAGRALECGDLSPLSPAADLSAANTGSSSRVDLFKKAWPHAPVHKLTEHGVYFVTAGTLHKERLFTDARRLHLLESKLLELANQYHWQIEAWAVFANHYHFVARGFHDSANLGKYLKTDQVNVEDDF